MTDKFGSGVWTLRKGRHCICIQLFCGDMPIFTNCRLLTVRKEAVKAGFFGQNVMFYEKDIRLQF